MRFMIPRKADAETEAGTLPGEELLAAIGGEGGERMRAQVEQW
jgi:hypothetical protein